MIYFHHFLQCRPAAEELVPVCVCNKHNDNARRCPSGLAAFCSYRGCNLHLHCGSTVFGGPKGLALRS